VNYTIPTTVLDNFFDDPYEVRKFALEQEYFTDPNHTYPGKRSRELNEINRPLFQHVIDRVNAIFYRASDVQGWSARVQFQIIDKSFQTGWIHRDNEIISGIVYLNPDPDLNSGTTIYKPKFTGASEKMYPQKYLQPEESRLENNEQFVESIVVKNQFNRLIAFDAKEYHSANNYFGENDSNSRLTLVFFIEHLSTRYYPIQRLRLI
jgi:hypothetical protein